MSRPNHIEGQFIVKFAPGGAAIAETAGLAEKLGARVMHQDAKGLQLWSLDGPGAAQALEALRNNPAVDYVEENLQVSIGQLSDDPKLSSQWALNHSADFDIDAPEAWDLATRGDGVTVAVIDTGIDYRHPDLDGAMWRNAGEIAGNGKDDDGNGYVDDVFGWDFVNNDANPLDDHSHGTHVAGTIGAEGNNGAGISGVAWSASMMALKAFDASGNGSSYNIARALDYAVSMGADISNNSWMLTGFSRAVSDAIARAGQADHLVVLAAGNNGVNVEGTSYTPTMTHANMLTVAAHTSSGGRASWSNYGSKSIDISAPGAGILSTMPGGGYGYKSGTSMATPHATGTAALVWSANPTLTALEVRKAIMDSVDPMASMKGLTVTGGGLNAAKALATFSTPVATADDSATVAEDKAVSINVLANDGAGLVVTATGKAAHGTATVSADGGSVLYTPNADFFGTDSFTYSVSDGKGGLGQATVTVTVTPVGDAPVAVNDAVSTAAGQTVTIAALANDRDPDGDPLTITGVGKAANGTATVTADGALAYTPKAGFTGTDTFTYTISDGRDGAATATVSVSVAPAGTSVIAPVFSSAGISAYDVQDGAGTVTVGDGGARLDLVGNLWKKAALDATIAPDTVLTFDVRIDRLGEIQGIGVDVDSTINNGNDMAFVLAGSQASPGWAALNYSLHGTVGSAWQTVSIDLGKYVSGPVKYLTFLNDHDGGAGDASASYANIRLTSGTALTVNTAPRAADDTAATVAGTPVTVAVLANDGDPDGDALTVSGLGAAGNGTAVLNADGTVTYTPGAGFTGTDSFSYTVSDGRGATDTASVGVTVAAPVESGSGVYSPALETSSVSSYGNQDGSSSVSVAGTGSVLSVSGNAWKKIPIATSITADTRLVFEARIDSLAEIHGIGLDADNIIDNGNDIAFVLGGSQAAPKWATFNHTYKGAMGSEWATISIDVGAHYKAAAKYLTFINDHDVSNAKGGASFANIRFEGAQTATNSRPVAVDDTARTVTGGSVTLDVTANDTDPDGDALAVTAVGAPGYGTATVGSDGRVTYRPDNGFTGTDTFTYTVGDGRGGEATGTVAVTVDAQTGYTPTLSGARSYGDQDGVGGATLSADGTGLTLSGNAWKAVAADYMVTANTVLTFDARINSLAEIHGIGVDADAVVNNGNDIAFVLGGSQKPPAWAIFDSTHAGALDGTWRTVSIEIGKVFTGDIDYLTFVNDHDVASPTGSASFANIRFTEGHPVSGGAADVAGVTEMAGLGMADAAEALGLAGVTIDGHPDAGDWLVA